MKLITKDDITPGIFFVLILSLLAYGIYYAIIIHPRQINENIVAKYANLCEESKCTNCGQFEYYYKNTDNIIYVLSDCEEKYLKEKQDKAIRDLFKIKENN